MHHHEHRAPWIAVFSVPQAPRPAADQPFIGDGHDILLQGFHWHSYAGANGKNWYQVLRENAPTIRSSGFSRVWCPPCSDSLDYQGYLPRRWYHMQNWYGGEADVRAAIEALGPVKAIADVVLNHRAGCHTPGADFEYPAFPDNRAAVTRTDPSGCGTGNPCTGETFPAARNLDHTNGGVRATIRDYLGKLRGLGFTGWRYDLCKGYNGRFVAEYNEATQPEFSVGEFFESDRQKVINWLDAAGGKSTAFDFPTRYLLYNACLSDDYTGLRSWNGGRSVPGGLIGMWPSRAVTFVDNHDTEYRRDAEHQSHYDSTRHFPGRSVDMAYAYTLTHPGAPCVFWSHFFDWGAQTRQRIERLIQVRKYTGVHARSWVDIREARRGLYAAFIDGQIAVKLGTGNWSPGGGWQLAVDGERFAVWVMPKR
jgi:alpha-amylase